MRAKRLAAWIAGVVIVLGIVALLAVGWIGSERAIHPRVAHYPKSLADFPDLHPQDVSFYSRTRTRIAAEFIPGERRATIVLSHGYGDNKVQMLPYADFLHKRGFSTLVYDMRNRGQSAGDAVTLGALEQLDLISAVDYLAGRHDVDRDHIGAMGVSLGGSTTLLAAAADPRIKAVLDDSGFSDAPRVIEASFEHFIGLPPFPFAPVTMSIVHLRTGLDVNGIRPVDVIARISPRPLLIIHCMQDTVVPPDNSDRNFAAARDPKQFWRIPTGGHIDGLKVAGDQYRERVSRFFEESLR
jgi:fermentation-respiration switch protein FrsA (DUF1100 family)